MCTSVSSCVVSPNTLKLPFMVASVATDNALTYAYPDALRSPLNENVP